MTKREKGEIMRHCIAGVEAQESATEEIDAIMNNLRDIRTLLEYGDRSEQQFTDIYNIISETLSKVLNVGANLMILDDAIDAISVVADIDLSNPYPEQEEN